MAKLISKTYGEALFELAVEENKIDVFLEEITAVIQILNENKEFNDLMNHPKINKEEKIEVISNVFENRISKELVGFLVLIITKDRYKETFSIFTYFLDRVKELKGIGVVYVTTAVELKGEQKKQVENRLLETTSYKQLEMHYQMETSIIGGMIIRIGDRVVDRSVSTKINELQKQLIKIQLA